jgi:transposase, IS30 family
MGKSYDQLSLDERIKLAQLHGEGFSIREIASDLDRSPSTVARELKRNTGQQVGYRPAHAQERTRARRWKGSRLERDPGLAKEVLDCLKKGWSPEQTCAWLARIHGQQVISPESIYRFIYAQIGRTKNYEWRHYLPRAKSKRGWRGRRGGSSALHIQSRISIAERPSEVEDRSVPGH